MFNRKPKATIAPLLKQWLSQLDAGQPLGGAPLAPLCEDEVLAERFLTHINQLQ